jgi:hypothetical protein
MKTFTLGIILSLALCTFSQEVLAHECTASDVAGRYGYTSTGSIVSPPVGPFSAVGHVTFTETGALTGAQTTSIAGNLVEETIQGTFVVNPDCTGSATVQVFHGATLARTSVINLVWDDHEREARAIFLTAGTDISIQARKMAGD